MKAAVARRYGPPEVIAVETCPDPRPGPDDILIAVTAAGLTSGDARIRAARAPAGMGLMMRAVFGLTRPRRIIPGREYAGSVRAVGANVTRFRPGDAVFGITDGLTLGAHAELVCVKAEGLVQHKPDSLSDTEAAAFFFGGLTAADFLLDQCRLTAADRLLVIGGTGAVGSAAIQIGRSCGARITALTGPENAELARTLGADITADYRNGLPPGPFDVILDIPGILPCLPDCLAPQGRLGRVTATLGQMIGAAARPIRDHERRLHAGVIKESATAQKRLLTLHEAGHYRPLPGRSFPLQAVVEAHRLADSGHKRGNITLHMAD